MNVNPSKSGHNPMRLYVNIDHVATVRQARRADEPDPVEAARICEDAGADGITAHLREDRRHIGDDDVRRLATAVRTVLNLELATAPDIVALTEQLAPHQVTFVPERREEVTTEGGLQLGRSPEGDRKLAQAVARLCAAGARTSLFVDPDVEAMAAAAGLGADAVELHTGAYANAFPEADRELDRLRAAATRARESGLAVHAGHGLTTRNVAAVAAIAEIEELNIGHHIVSRAIMVGLGSAVEEMRAAIAAVRVD